MGHRDSAAIKREKRFLGRLRPVLNRFAKRGRERGRWHCATGLTQYLAGMPGTFGTLTANPKFPTKITQALATVLGCFPYVTISDAVAKTNVHGYAYSSVSGKERNPNANCYQHLLLAGDSA